MQKSRIIVTGAHGVLGKAVVADLREHGHEVIEVDLALGHNLSDEAFVREWFAKNPADHLVNLFALNDHIATGGKRQTLMDIDLAGLRQYLDVNVVALFSVCREFARNNLRGSIVNFSSIYGLVSPVPSMYEGGEKHIGYSASKAAVVQLSRHLAVHLAPKFRVNCIAPGGVANAQPGKFDEVYSQRTPMGRMMRKEEVCGMVRFLVSDDSSYCTAGVYAADGGWTAW